MKRNSLFTVMMCTIILSLLIPTIVAAESSPEWKTFPAKTEVDIDKQWTIKFNQDIDYKSLYGNITVVRERDNRTWHIEPVTYPDRKSVILPLGELYDFNETYCLYIKNVRSVDGKTLKEPIKMKFQTINPHFNDPLIIDGVKFEISVSKTSDKLYAKIKATNISENTIPYIGYNGCDKGLNAHLYAKTDSGLVAIGDKWVTKRICTQAEEQYYLEPGETIEELEVLYPPEEPVKGYSYLLVRLIKGDLFSNDPNIPIEIRLPIELD